MFPCFSCFREFCIAFSAFEIAFIFSNFYELPLQEKKIPFVVSNTDSETFFLALCRYTCSRLLVPSWAEVLKLVCFLLYPRMYHVKCQYVSFIFLRQCYSSDLWFLLHPQTTACFLYVFLFQSFLWHLAQEPVSRGWKVGLSTVSCSYSWVHQEDLQLRFSFVSWGASLMA